MHFTKIGVIHVALKLFIRDALSLHLFLLDTETLSTRARIPELFNHCAVLITCETYKHVSQELNNI